MIKVLRNRSDSSKLSVEMASDGKEEETSLQALPLLVEWERSVCFME